MEEGDLKPLGRLVATYCQHCPGLGLAALQAVETPAGFNQLVLLFAAAWAGDDPGDLEAVHIAIAPGGVNVARLAGTLPHEVPAGTATIVAGGGERFGVGQPDPGEVD